MRQVLTRARPVNSFQVVISEFCLNPDPNVEDL